MASTNCALHVSLDSDAEKTITLNLNCDTYELTYTGVSEVKKIELDYLLYFSVPGPRTIELNFAQNVLLPTTTTFYFSSSDDCRVLEDFLTNWEREVRGARSYTNQMLPQFLQTEFVSLCPDMRNNSVAPEPVKRYLNRAGLRYVTVPQRGVSTFGWGQVYHQLMDAEHSVLLEKVFQRFSTWVEDNVPRIMKPNNLLDFLQRHQEEETVTEEDVRRIIRAHVNRDEDNNRDWWNVNEFIGFLLSEENSLESPSKVALHQDMTLPMSNYWINTSHESYLSNIGSTEASVKAYEVLLRRGVRCIRLDVKSFHREELPYVCKIGRLGAATNKLKLKSVLETIKANAFVASEYPLIISLGIHCDHKRQTAMAKLFKEVFGESLLTKKVSPQEINLPAPEALKRKIILSAVVPGDPEEETRNDDQDEFYLGRVWFRLVDKTDKDWKSWKPKEMVWKISKRTIAFGTPTCEAVHEICEKPYFVGFIEKSTLKEFLRQYPRKQRGNFLVRSLDESFNRFVLSIVLSNRGKEGST